MQFQYFATGKSFTDAVAACASMGGFLAKVNTRALAYDIKEHVPVNARLRIGAEGCRGNPGYYCWLDGTFLTVDLNIYVNTLAGTCFLYRTDAKTESAALGTMNCPGPFPFLCQMERPPPRISNTTLVLNDISTHSVNCTTDHCSPTWITEDGVEIPQNSSLHGVQQYVMGTMSQLRFTNVTEDASGIYYCRTQHNTSTYENVTVTILGKPTIRTVTTDHCSSHVVVSWTPDKQAVNLEHRIQVGGKVFSETPTTEAEQSLAINTLAPSTDYSLTIKPCTGDCTLNLATRPFAFHTGGKASSVKGLSSRLGCDMKCVVSWNPLPSSLNITSYMVEMNETALITRPKSAHMKSRVSETKGAMYKFAPRPNMDYSITVWAKNCAGTGHAVTIQSNCRVHHAAPENVAQPSVISDDALLMPKMNIPIPDEATGLISCLLVFISADPTTSSGISDMTTLYTIDELTATLTAKDSKEYLAFAISPEKFVKAADGNLMVTVGDDSQSSCDLTKTSTDAVPMKESCNKREILCGMNTKLQKDSSYRAYVIAVVNVNDSLSLSRSFYANFETRASASTGKGTATIAIMGGVFGGLLFLALVVIIVVVVKKRKA